MLHAWGLSNMLHLISPVLAARTLQVTWLARPLSMRSRRRVVALDIGWLRRSDRSFQPLACHLPEVFKRQSCHGQSFNMDRNAPFSSHHCLIVDSSFVARIFKRTSLKSRTELECAHHTSATMSHVTALSVMSTLPARWRQYSCADIDTR